MAAGWIAQGPPQPISAGSEPDNAWTPTGPPQPIPGIAGAARPHQDPNAHPIENTQSLYQRGKTLLFGHEPDSPTDPDQTRSTGLLPYVGLSPDNHLEVGALGHKTTIGEGPDVSTLARAYPHLLGAQVGKIKAGYQEGVGALQTQDAERTLAGYTILPQVAARVQAAAGPAPTDPRLAAAQALQISGQIAQDPNVAKQARNLGISPQEFAADWARIATQTPEQQADAAARAQDLLAKGKANSTAGQATRNQAWADERVWQPSDLANGKLEPWSVKNIAFQAALGIPALAATAGATAVGGPVGGTAAAAAIFGPQAYSDAKDKLDDQVSRILQKADDLDDGAPVGGKRGLNPVTEQLRQQAADLAASSDTIARTAGFLNAVGAAAGNVPVVSILARSPVGKAMLDRMVGAAAAQTVGGRIAAGMVANGAGAMLQASIQKAVDAGIVHEQTSLKDALTDIAQAGVVGMATALPVLGIHEAAGAPARARARRDLESDQLLAKVRAASDAMGAPPGAAGETYPGFTWNNATGKYEPTAANAAANATKPRLSGPIGPSGETNPPNPATGGPNPATKGPSGETGAPGAAGARQAYQAKVDTLNAAAATAEKRSDVSLQPEEEGWSVHVKGQPVAQFDTVEAARQAMASARKLVGTAPAAAENLTEPLPQPVVPREPETDLERTQPLEPSQPERRTATELRARVSDMNPDQLRAALLTHELSGIPNRRAYEDAPKKAVQVSADSDSLKAINDVAGHFAGDQAIKAVAQAMHAEAPGDVFHISGDEFQAQADTEDEAHDLMGRVNQRLQDAVVEVTMPDGRVFHLKGLGVSYGVGKDNGEAEGNLQTSKAERQAQGLRAPRGELPPGATIRSRQEGGQGDGGQVAGQPGVPKNLSGGGGATVHVLGQPVKKPAVPTEAQARSGNYFKPAIAWHGVPIKVENVKGQRRQYLDAKTGAPGTRVMKADYGYFPGTKGNDEDGVDVMMGPHPEERKAYVIDQMDHTGIRFDEHKVQIGVRSVEEARAQYLSHYPKDWKGLGGITELGPEELKRWLKEGDLTKPINPESVSAVKAQRGPLPDTRHDSILEYLARHPLGLDRQEAQSHGVDPADMALSAAHVGIKRAFRKGGMSFDHAAETLHQAGYPVTDAQGHYSPNVLLDRIDDELRGRPHYSVHNQEHLPEAEHARDWSQPLSDHDLAALSIEGTQARLKALQAEQERLEREIERAGLTEPAEHESREDLDRIPFQRKEGSQPDLFGDKVTVQNEIKRLESALDKKRNTGQESVETGKSDDLFSQARDQGALFKRGESQPQHLTVTGVRAVVHRFLEGFSVRPEVMVVDTLHDLDDHPEVGHIVRDTANEDAVAFVHPRTNKIYLIADQITSPEHAASVLAHEYVTHFGLRAAFGDRRNAQYQAILEGVAKAMPAELRVRGEQEFPGRFNPMNRNQRNVAAEEVLAYYGQQYAVGQSVPAQAKRWFEKLFAMIRDWWRQAWGLPQKFDEWFVKRTLADLESFLRSRGSAEQDATRPRSAASDTRSGPAFAGKQDTFFSGLAKAVDAAGREKGTGAEWEATLKNMPGVRQEELQWTGLKDWLEGRGRVTKAEVAEYVAAHRVQLGEVEKGSSSEQPPLGMTEIADIDRQLTAQGLGGIGPEQDRVLRAGGPEAAGLLEHLTSAYDVDLSNIPRIEQEGERGGAKFAQYVTPGGKNYRELLMTLPRTKEAIKADYDAVHRAQRRVVAETDSRLYERRFLDFLNPHHQVERANAVHWLYDVSSPDRILALEAHDKLAATVKRLSEPFRDDAWQVMQGAIDAHRRLRQVNEEEAAATPVRTAIPEFRQSHWDEPNVLAHIRFDDRTGPNGERVLHVAEIQSDWHQQGRRHGYEPTLPEKAKLESRRKELEAIGRDATSEQKQEWAAIMNQLQPENGNRPPDAPFKTTWPELAIKRILRLAVEGHYDALSWDTGDTNAERYDLSKHLDRVEAIKHVDAKGFRNYQLKVINKRGHTIHDGSFEEKRLEGYVGKELAEKIINQPPGNPAIKYEGLDLKVGGEGMKKFYDQMLPATVGKLVKKWGGSVEPLTLPAQELDIDITHADEPGAPQGWASTGDDVVPSPALNVHSVAITPRMRDSVMGGQPMFLKRRKGSAGTAAPAPKKGAYDLARRAIAAIPNSEFLMSFRRIADPAGVSEPATATALVAREAFGELAQESEEALQNLERYAKAFDLLPTQDRYDFIDAMETGSKQPHVELQPAADAIRALLDDWRERIRGLGVGALDNFIENYFPHIWNLDSEAKKVFGQIFGRRPLKGPASFLKERTIPTTKEGLAAGLTPVSTNPLVLAFAKLREMQRFYTGVKLMQRFKDEGLAKFLPSGKLRPDDWAEIEDAVGRVRQWSEAEQGFIERGHYIMPVDAARVINNHLSASALRNFLPAQLFRSMSNAVNALQLGFSAFHLGFTTLDAVISKNALAIERLLHGEPLKAVQALLEANSVVGGVGMNLVRGQRLLKAYSNISGATPEMRRIVEGLMAAGGRVKMDNYFQAAQGLSPFKGVGFATLAHDVKMALTQPHDKVRAATQVLTSFPQQYATRLWRDLVDMTQTMHWPALTVPLEVAGRMTRASTSIIMEHIVPLQKLGVFSDLAADHIRRNPFEDSVAFAAAMQSIWNSVDNRLGEMVYDNVFWNRTFKDVNHMMVRAVGWNLGTVRELFGAPVDVVKLLDYVARGAPAEDQAPSLGKDAKERQGYEEAKAKLQRIAEKVGHKIPYTLALIGTTMILGAVLTRLLTGKDPEELKDYFFPRTGRTTKYGTPERISMPSYAKDLYEYGTQPVTTVINKANPIFGIIHSIYANEDFFGNAVRNPDASSFEQMLDGAKYAGRQIQPFSLQGAKQFAGAGEMNAKGEVLTVAPYVGFGPAPARVTSPEQMDRYQLRETEKAYIRGLQRQLKAATTKGDKAAVDQLRSEIRESKLKERSTERDIRQDKVKARETADKISSLIEGHSRTEAAAALESAGYPAFADLWRSLPERPRARVASSLEEFA